MSSSFYSILAQSSTDSDWNWLLIFIIFVVVLVVALIVQAIFSKKEVDEFEHHEAAVHLEAEPKRVPEAESESEDETEPKPETEPQGESEAMSETPAEPDDLKLLEGIGPKVAGLLGQNGITTFAQLASTPVEKLEEILNANKLQMLRPDSWPQQARLAAVGDWEGLEKLQQKLQGGRSS
jgi:predicted flap endonuclease-1-like 5' DNA nuclease